MSMHLKIVQLEIGLYLLLHTEKPVLSHEIFLHLLHMLQSSLQNQFITIVT